MRLSLSNLLAPALAVLAATTPAVARPGNGDGANLPVVTHIGDALLAGTLVLQMEGTAFSPGELYLIATPDQLLPQPISLGSQGVLHFAPWTVVLPGDPSQTSTYPVPNNEVLVGLALQIQGLGLIIEGVQGELRLSNLVSVPIMSPAPSALSYSDNPATYLEGQAITDNVPSVTGVPDLYEVAPDLPTGLTINAQTGVISGTPTDSAPSSIYTVTATNGQGQTAVDLTLAVDPMAPTFFEYTDNPVTYTTADEVSNPPLIDAAIDTYIVQPALPAGLILDPATGIIGGTPTTLTPQAGYLVTASNVSGSIQTTVTITVTPAPPTDLEYSSPWVVYAAGSPIAPNVPSLTAQIVDSFSVQPALPAGLNLNPTTGVITGTPAIVSNPQVLTAYTVTATNVSGSDDADVEIVIDSLPPPQLSAAGSSEPGGDVVFDLAGTLTVGGITEVLSVDVLRTVPPVFSPGFGLVYLNQGTPTYQTFDGDGSHQWTFSIPNDPQLIGTTYYAQASGFVFFGVGGAVRISNVTETLISLPAPTNLAYPVASETYFVDEPADPNTPTVDGFVQTWSVDPPLPGGLMLSSVDGTISGTPTGPAAQATYTVTAENTEGETTADVEIRVIDGQIAQFAFTVNGGDSTLSAFGVDSDSGQLRHLSYAQTGAGPAAVAVTPDGRFVYSANALDGTISSFRLDQETGLLAATGAALADLVVDGLVVHESGDYLYATVTAGTSGLYGYSIDDVTGLLTALPGSPFGVGTLPNDVAIHDDVVATCSANAADTVDTYSIDPGTGVLTVAASLATGASPRGVEFSFDGAFLYAVNQNDDSVSAYSVGAGGALAELGASPFDVLSAGGDGPEDVATTKGGFLYTANLLSGSTTGFSIALDGSLIPLGSTLTGTSPRAVMADEQGQRLYVVNEFDDEVEIFDVSVAGGLSPATPSLVRTRSQPNSLAIASGLFPLTYSSDRAYVAAQNENRVYEYTLAPTGAVSQLGLPDATLALPGGAVLHPAQDYLYITAQAAPGVGTYEVLADGQLAGIPPGTTSGVAPWSTVMESSGRYGYTSLANAGGGVQLMVRQGDGTLVAGAISATGARSRRLAVGPAGRFLYVPNEDGDTLAQFQIDPGNGALIPLVPATIGTNLSPVVAAVHPSGRFVYSAASASDFIDVYSVGLTGNLTPVTQVALGGTGAVDIAIEPRGQFLYVAFEDSDELEAYSISETTGIPTELFGGLSPIPTGDEPVFVTINPAGTILYVVHRGTAEQIRHYSLNPISGQLIFQDVAIANGTGLREMAINTKLDQTTE